MEVTIRGSPSPSRTDGYGYGNGSGYGSGDGNGSGYGSGDGNGSGSGSGYGYGYGSGSGDGNGYGYGSGDGNGSGSGYGDGNGYGSGSGDGNGSGSGYGDGNGYGSGYGDGNGFLWRETIASFAKKWSKRQRARLASLQEAGATIAFWRSDERGCATNGGKSDPVKPGTIETSSGPLILCKAGVLHATLTPLTWRGARLWIVALVGDVIGDDEKYGALKREIIGECL